MPNEKSSTVPEGLTKVETKTPFIKFENEGDSFHGFYRECKEVESKKYGNRQIVWLCVEFDTGEIVQISEKTVMSNFRLMMKNGTEFFILYKGEVKPEKGSKYKDFEFYLK